MYCISKSDLVERKCHLYNTCHNKKGFTLVEIIAVVVIISVLAVYASGVFDGQLEEAKIAASATEMKALNEAIERYYKDNNMVYPRALEIDAALISYLSKPVAEILRNAAELVGPNDYSIYTKYKVIVPPKRGTTMVDSRIDDGARWLTMAQINAEANPAILQVKEIRVSDM